MAKGLPHLTLLNVATNLMWRLLMIGSGIWDCLWTVLNEMQLKFSGANVCEYKSVRLVHNWKTSFICLVRLQDLCITLGVLWF